MSPASASADKTERLLNLILALKSARRPVSKQKIRESLPAYAAATSDEAFDRMFERDKDELREMGIPITTTVLDVLFDDEVGYRIDASETTLPAITLRARRGRRPGAGRPRVVDGEHLRRRVGGPAQAAPLRASRSTSPSAAGAEPRIRTKEPAFEAVHAAVSALQPITFDYRRNDGELTTRHVQPWALKNWHGRWYLTGFDVDRGDERAFRLSRFEGTVRRKGRAGSYAVPSDHVPEVALEAQLPEPEGTAVVRVRHGRGPHAAPLRPAHHRDRRAVGRDRGALPPRHDRARRRRPGHARRGRVAARARRGRPLGAAGSGPGTPRVSRRQAQRPRPRRHDRRHRHERFEAVGSTSARRDGDAAARAPARHGAVAAPAPRRADLRGRARVRRRRGPGRRGPRAALRLRHAGLRPRRAHRRPVGQRPHLPRQRRRHRRPHASDP